MHVARALPSLVLLSTLFAVATAPAAFARPARLIDLTVVDRDTGQPLAPHYKEGRAHVAGVPGHRYAVRLTNRSGARVLAVLSVDGVNAVTGETASPDQGGYVLGPWESTQILGWRKSLDEVAQFTFTALPDSYASQTGRPANVGVIGVAVFEERQVPIERKRTPQVSAGEAPAAAPAAPREEAEAADAAPQRAQASAARPAERLGTGHGERETSTVTQTRFVRASSRPAEQVAIGYDSYRNLVARGIIVRPVAEREPVPFPGAFVPDPPRR